MKELPEEDVESLIDCRGTLKVSSAETTLGFLFRSMVLTNLSMFQVWRVNGNELSLVPVSEQKKLFSGDCYIVQYTYPGNGRDENLFYAWLGRESIAVSIVLLYKCVS